MQQWHQPQNQMALLGNATQIVLGKENPWGCDAPSQSAATADVSYHCSVLLVVRWRMKSHRQGIWTTMSWLMGTPDGNSLCSRWELLMFQMWTPGVPDGNAWCSRWERLVFQMGTPGVPSKHTYWWNAPNGTVQIGTQSIHNWNVAWSKWEQCAFLMGVESDSNGTVPSFQNVEKLP